MCKKTLPGFRFIKTAITANSDLLIFLKIALFFGQGRDKMNKIMVVDDDQTILKVIRSNLERHDFQVLTAMDPKNALDKMNGEAFDLALVDLMLNGESGLDLMENLHRLNPEMPIIILTGYGTIESAVEAMKKGAHSYLTKPFEFRELFYQIHGHGLDFLALTDAELIEKPLQRLGLTLFADKNNATGNKVQHDGQITLTLSNRNLVYG
jgi:DNA-binding response OmpR family regulator